MTDIVQAPHQGRIVPMIFREPGAPARAAGAAPVNSLGFTAWVKVNKTDVPIKAANILDMATQGIEFDLIPPGRPEDALKLGNLQDLIGWLAEQMNFTAPDWNNVPKPLEAITKVDAYVNKLYVKANKDSLEFDLIVTLTFNWVLVKGLELTSFSFQLKRQQPADPTPPPPDTNG